MDTKQNVLSNLIWRFIERTGAQGVTLIVSIILARILNPNAFGVVAIVTVILEILQVFIDSGFGNALIQKKDADDIDFSTVFFFNIFICILLYIILFFLATIIAAFYKISELTLIIRILGLTVIISGIKNIQQAYVSKKLLFKKFFYSTLGGTILAAIIGIVLALKGFGVWALVIQSLVNNLVDTAILWITVKWRPKLVFSFKRLKKMFAFGWKILVTSLLETIYNDLGQLIIGKKYTTTQLAFFNKGKQFPNYIVTNINSSIKSVMFPVFSSVQDEIIKVKAMMRRAIKVSSFIISPLIVGFVSVSNELVILLLTKKWIPCIPYFCLFSISFLFQPIQTTNKSVIKALGESSILLKVQLIVRVLGIVMLVISMNFGVLYIAISVVISSILEQFLLAKESKKILNYGYFEQLKDIMPSLILSIFMGIIVYFIHFFNIPLLFKVFIQIMCGGLIYIIGAKIMKNETFEYLLTFVKQSLIKNKNE